jgi:DNA-binding SARP family transcriptional activator
MMAGSLQLVADREALHCRRPEVQLGLLDGFEFRCDGEVIELPLSTQRVVAFLALHERPLRRLHVAGCLWPDSTEERAGASLRSALWRLHRLGHDLVEATSAHLQLAAVVGIDFRETVATARAVLDHQLPNAALALAEMSLCDDLLPDWYDDWVLFERERLSQLRIRALESLCEQLGAAGMFGSAVEAGMTAVRSEPLRESANRALIAAHLAEGNRGEALRQFERFRDLLWREIRVEPSDQMRELTRELGIPTSSRV